MKIYFDGGSWCWGSELEQPFISRYSKIISDKLGAEEYNISRRGGSNTMMERQLLVNHKNIKEFDLAIIQMVYPRRNEYYSREKKFFVPNAEFKGRYDNLIVKNEKDLIRKAWLNFYKYIYEDEYGFAYEEMHATAIRSFCKLNGVPLILCTTKKKHKCQTKYDIYCHDVPKAKNGHPNEEGHVLHALMMLDFYENLL